MIINSVKVDGVDQLSGPVDVSLWGWDNLMNLYVEVGEDPETGEKRYGETDRIVVGKKIEIELHNDEQEKETIALMLWYWTKAGICGNISSRLVEFESGKTDTITLGMAEPARAAWCLMRQ